MDKLEPIEFALQTVGTTYRVHGDRYPKLVQSQLPKTFRDSTVFHLMISALRDTGRQWEGWGCEPFQGSPDSVIGPVVERLKHNGEVAS